MRRPHAALGLALLILAPGTSAHAATAPRVAEFTLGVHAKAPLGAREAGAARRVTTGVLQPGRRFDLLGLRWRGPVAARDARVQVRVGGRWLKWVPLAAADDHGPDDAGATHGTDPVWAGGADALRLSFRGRPRHLRLHFVRVTHRPQLHRRAHAAQAGAPPIIYPRDAWDPGDQCRPRTSPEFGTVEFAFVHHTVSANSYGRDESPAMVLAICRYHRNSNGWNDIGYNFLVDKYGQLFEGRAGGIDQPVVGAQAQGWNDQSTSISNIGTYSSVPASAEAVDAMANLLAWKLPLEGVPVTGTVTLRSGGGSLNRYPSGSEVPFQRISGHRDGGKTECPGGALYAQLPDIRALAAERAPEFAAPPPPTDAGAVTINAVATQLLYPQPAELSGTLTGGGRVSIQVQSGGRFVTIARADPGGDGSWAASLRLSSGHLLRALQVLPDGRAGAASEPVRVTVQPKIKARARSRVLAGRSLTLAGEIGPYKSSLSLSLAIQRGTRYVVVSRRGLPARRGAFRTPVRLRRPGLYRLHVRFAGDAGALPASADVYVRAVRTRAGLQAPRRGVNGGSVAPQG